MMQEALLRAMRAKQYGCLTYLDPSSYFKYVHKRGKEGRRGMEREGGEMMLICLCNVERSQRNDQLGPTSASSNACSPTPSLQTRPETRGQAREAREVRGRGVENEVARRGREAEGMMIGAGV